MAGGRDSLGQNENKASSSMTTPAIPRRAGGTVLALAILASCEGGAPLGGDDFQARYAAARGALEEGRFEVARNLYPPLIAAAGPVAPRLRLEYAHTLLRDGDFGGAEHEADVVARGTDGDARAAALAVRGTAQHEIGEALLAAGEPAAAELRLAAAREALRQVLDSDADLDPLGAMTRRLDDIEALLSSL